MLSVKPKQDSMFRSLDMSLIQLYIPSELAHSVVSEIGELSMVQFRDLNPDANAFQRNFINELKRLDEMERRLRYLKQQLTKQHIKVHEGQLVPVDRTMQQLEETERQLQGHEEKLLQLNGNQISLNKSYLELQEQRYVLQECAYFLQQQLSDFEDDAESGIRLQFVTGVVPTGKQQVFEKILWRALRGNVYVDHAQITESILDPVTEEPIFKNVFIVFCHGQEVAKKIQKISEGLGATIYEVASSDKERSIMLKSVQSRLADLETVLNTGQLARRQELMKVAEHWQYWNTFVHKEKLCYSTMDLFNYDGARKCLIAEGWIPSNSMPAIQYALHAVSERHGSLVPPIMNELKTVLEPPTFQMTNKYTSAFQTIIDSYGIARYKEVNPGLFTVITFPFLFAVMFGDFGHGVFVFLAGVYMIWNEKKLDKPGIGEMFGTVFGGRYIVLLMGFFSMYVGLIYNDLFSLPLYISNSGWDVNILPRNGTGPLNYTSTMVGVYPFGIDHVWHLSENSLLFLNSYKMKMSIIIGVIHMSFGIFLTVFNSKYFKKPLNIFCEFIPQILFFWSIFGYLVFLIIFKWLYPWNITDATPVDQYPPNLLNALINMFLKMGGVAGPVLFSGQAGVQTFLLILALLCVPWMLCLKPYLLYRQHQKIVGAGYATINGESPGSRSHDSEIRRPDIVVDMQQPGAHDKTTEVLDDAASSVLHAHHNEAHGEKFEFGEIVVHQTIHTIEFCLGCISNTASYLRLWALSLAHAQLSEVLFHMTIAQTMTSSYTLIIGYYIWFSGTIGILVGMEGLSAFLHALRLHWVEFNGKFYEGVGIQFVPFTFKVKEEQ